MNELRKQTLEQVSALMDGEMPANEVAQVVQQVAGDDVLRASWQTYHLVGEVLRTGRHAVCTDSDAFLDKLRQRMAQEPPVLRPRESTQPPVAWTERAEAANEPVFRWRLVAGVASVAVAAAVGWGFVSGGGATGGAQIARQDAAVPTLASATPAPAQQQSLVQVGNRPEVMLRDARLDELLEAHQAAGGASQMPSGFLRNATFETPSR
ncbi:sigma-E factor negative regulatory protein [uncultured Pseudacidovorax sp.]|uniref:sigma-E factor negative regulatory protein n=1 Tax=uncultured Pseudacidovorax sp. TaxID=679313 RepID=UPI0025F39843|nr:sigma-E factor negative regulatory protein [uncultured Pseudacidovorax sp.]